MGLSLKELKDRDTARNIFDNAMKHITNIAVELTKRMNLDGKILLLRTGLKMNMSNIYMSL